MPALLDVYRHAVRARAAAERLEILARAGRIGFHPPALRTEVATVAAALALEPHDFVAPTPRDLAAALARGVPVAAYLAHAVGSARDRQLGHSAPGLFSSREHGVLSPSQLVAQHLTQAAGFAWAMRLRRAPGAVLAFLGKAAADAGDFHSAVNFAGVTKAPIVFLVRRGAEDGAPPPAPGVEVVDKAIAYGVTSAECGGGPAEVGTAVTRAMARARAGEGPTLLEVRLGPEGDPLAELRATLARDGTLSETDDFALRREIMGELEAETTAAIAAGPPPRTALFAEVFAEVPAHLAAEAELLERAHEVNA